MESCEIDIAEPGMSFDSIGSFEPLRYSSSGESGRLLSILHDDGIRSRDRIESTRAYSILLFADERLDKLLTFSRDTRARGEAEGGSPVHDLLSSLLS